LFILHCSLKRGCLKSHEATSSIRNGGRDKSQIIALLEDNFTFESASFVVVGVAGLPSVITEGGDSTQKAFTHFVRKGIFLFREYQASLNSLIKKSPALRAKLFFVVGVAGFEPATSCSQRFMLGYYLFMIYCAYSQYLQGFKIFFHN
jgi:hypothetical protein